MAELVGLVRLHGHRPRNRRRALRDHHDRERRPAAVAVQDLVAHLVDVERLLGDEDDVGTAGETRVQRDPAGMAAHDLAHHHAVVALGGGVQAVDRVRRDLHRGVEAERHVGRGEVVVDRLGDAHDVHALGAQLRGDTERVLATDRDQRVDAFADESVEDGRDTAFGLVGVRARRPEDRPAPVEDPARRRHGQVDGLALLDAPPAVAEADEVVPVDPFALADDGPDHRIQARAVAASGQDADSHGLDLLASLVRWSPPLGIASHSWSVTRTRPSPWRQPHCGRVSGSRPWAAAGPFSGATAILYFFSAGTSTSSCSPTGGCCCWSSAAAGGAASAWEPTAWRWSTSSRASSRERVRAGIPLLQLVVTLPTDRSLVLEFRPRHRALGRRVAESLASARTSPA